MHFNIYLDEETGNRLTKVTKMSHQSRNALIREAINDWLIRHEGQQWPDLVLDFEGVPEFPAFESTRLELKPVQDDPLGLPITHKSLNTRTIVIK